MIHMTETLAVQTIEDFLTGEETTRLTELLDEHLATTGWVPVRPSEGMTPPEPAQAILEGAVRRALPALRRVFPSATATDPWLYHDLKPGDTIRPHVHGVGDPQSRPQRIARVAFNLQDAEDGARSTSTPTPPTPCGATSPRPPAATIRAAPASSTRSPPAPDR
ncbi:hypothetical protein ACFQ2B_33980 [Streptomyces stramineus]